MKNRFLCEEEDWKLKKVRNPKTGNQVQVRSLPPEEQKKYKPKKEKHSHSNVNDNNTKNDSDEKKDNKMNLKPSEAISKLKEYEIQSYLDLRKKRFNLGKKIESQVAKVDYDAYDKFSNHPSVKEVQKVLGDQAWGEYGSKFEKSPHRKGGWITHVSDFIRFRQSGKNRDEMKKNIISKLGNHPDKEKLVDDVLNAWDQVNKSMDAARNTPKEYEDMVDKENNLYRKYSKDKNFQRSREELDKTLK